MNSNRAIIDLINKALSLIVHKQDWHAFDELVLGIPDNKHEAQFEFLTGSTTPRESLLHPGNGWGKTEVIAKKHIFFILKHILDPTYRTCHTALTLDQALEVYDRILRMIDSSPLLKKIAPLSSFKRFPLPEIVFFNGAKILIRTTKNKGQAIEGKEFGYISCDEVALEAHIEFIREKIFLPRLRKWEDSQLNFFAAPKGKNGYFRVMKAIQRSGGYVRAGSSYENPYIDHKLLDYMSLNFSELKRKQIIEGEFVDNSALPFASRVEKLFDENLKLDRTLIDSHTYYEGWDLARGKVSENDMTFGYRIDKTSKVARVVDHWSFQLPWTEQGRLNLANEGDVHNSSIEREIRTRQSEHGNRGYLDSTGVGDTLYEMLSDVMIGVDFRGNKDHLLEHAQRCIDEGLIKSPYIPELAEQMSVYERNDAGMDTDAIMGFVVACQGLDLPTKRKKLSFSRKELKRKCHQ